MSVIKRNLKIAKVLIHIDVSVLGICSIICNFNRFIWTANSILPGNTSDLEEQEIDIMYIRVVNRQRRHSYIDTQSG